ncbi:PAS domain S-box protein [Pelagibius sp. Alg239-R121]|uniref:PAS domain S-box protein n=1 Tax=Pelagibius sp. Alg239-R121 TaxID=2993448 RepID=UPI0024A6611A|nr:PAS domain S-box protein [Pelagibius sp. Alg239-R121]
MTERDTLRQTEAINAASIANAMDCIITVDGAGKILAFNPEAEKTFGFAADEVIGRSLSENIIPDRMRNAHEKGLIRFLKTREANVVGKRIEIPARCADGREISVELSVTAFEIDRQPYFTAYLRDLSQQGETSIGSSGDKSDGNTAQRLARLGSWTWDLTQTEEIACSAELCDILGCARDFTPDFEGLLGFIHPEERDLVRQAIGEAKRDGMPHGHRSFKSDFRVVTPEGRVKFATGVGEVTFDDDAKPQLVYGTIQDVTDLRAVEQELIAARDEANHANHAKSEFLAMMSHEIRTPMNGVLGTLGLLQNMELPAQQHDLVQSARSSGDALLDILNDVLDFAKIEASKLELEEVAFSLPVLIRNIQRFWGHQFANKGLSFSVELPDGLPAFLVGDTGRLRQILQNFLSNALKYTAEGRVRLIISRDDSASAWEEGAVRNLRFSVIDSGVGIASGKQQSVFKAFDQLDRATMDGVGGTGLGLAISKRLAELMKGEIGFLSEEAVGSTFWIQLPLESAADAPEELDSEIADPADVTPFRVGSDKRKPRILLAEDNTTNQIVARELLLRRDCHVDVVANGSEAVEAVQARPYDLVLMDISMPVMDGIAATKTIRAENCPHNNVPIVALTAYAMKSDQETFAAVGMNGFVAKPVLDGKLLYQEMERILYAAASSEQPGATPAATDILIDQATLSSLTESLGEETMAKLRDSFQGDVERSLKQLHEAAEQGDVEALEHSSHTLKSVSGTFGAMRLQAQASAINTASRNSDFEGAKAALQGLETTCRDTLKVFHESNLARPVGSDTDIASDPDRK